MSRRWSKGEIAAGLIALGLFLPIPFITKQLPSGFGPPEGENGEALAMTGGLPGNEGLLLFHGLRARDEITGSDP